MGEEPVEVYFYLILNLVDGSVLTQGECLCEEWGWGFQAHKRSMAFRFT